ncbi:MAG: methyl-accepting chemotaxis protein [Deltaproteobacteria bacterium]|nr:methyl-accepting chemotaxis protein [Deltaproteobacteria bacterium]
MGLKTKIMLSSVSCLFLAIAIIMFISVYMSLRAGAQVAQERLDNSLAVYHYQLKELFRATSEDIKGLAEQKKLIEPIKFVAENVKLVEGNESMLEIMENQKRDLLLFVRSFQKLRRWFAVVMIDSAGKPLVFGGKDDFGSITEKGRGSFPATDDLTNNYDKWSTAPIPAWVPALVGVAASAGDGFSTDGKTIYLDFVVPVSAEVYDAEKDQNKKVTLGRLLVRTVLQANFVKTLDQITGTQFDLLLPDGKPALGTHTSMTENSEFLKRLTQEKLYRDISIDGEPFYQAMTGVTFLNQGPGAVSIVLSQKQVMSNIKNQLSAMAGVSLAAIVLMALVMYLISSRTIAKPIYWVISRLSAGADQVATASLQVASSSQLLAERAVEQASAVEETSSTFEELSTIASNNAEHADEANHVIDMTNQSAGTANRVMMELNQSMKEIFEASEQTAKIIKTIDEIAFQTNLLALNAAVEAARAGNAGVGFAVVADEVRNLALRAAEAAKSTSNLIDDTGKKVKDGSTLVSVTSQAFTQVADSSSKVAELVGEIAAASKEQAEGIEQSNRAISEVEKVTQQNASTAEESASASEELSAQAVQMKSYVMELMTLVGGKAHSREVKKSREESTTSVRVPMPAHRLEKTKEVRLIKGNGGREVRPERVIPMDDGDFKDF